MIWWCIYWKASNILATLTLCFSYRNNNFKFSFHLKRLWKVSAQTGLLDIKLISTYCLSCFLKVVYKHYFPQGTVMLRNLYVRYAVNTYLNCPSMSSCPIYQRSHPPTKIHSHFLLSSLISISRLSTYCHFKTVSNDHVITLRKELQLLLNVLIT